MIGDLVKNLLDILPVKDKKSVYIQTKFYLGVQCTVKEDWVFLTGWNKVKCVL